MSWKDNFWQLRHSMFVVFIELKIKGSWTDAPMKNLDLKGNFIVSTGEGCEIHLIEPDGLRRHLSFEQDAMISMNQNILTYNPDECDEITVDEKEQSGKGKTRDTLH
ncbi:MAG: hypothetical protein J4F36_11915 [Nitrosopumilaceae archaeon]|nr:hypothetical protein [Nitrosopumilaceae archaeon]